MVCIKFPVIPNLLQEDLIIGNLLGQLAFHYFKLGVGKHKLLIGALPDEELVRPQNYRHDGENKLHSPLF